MPGAKNPSLKDPELYEELRKDGNSKEKSARISNAAAKRGRSAVGRKGGESGSYDDWTVGELQKRVAEEGTGSRPARILAAEESGTHRGTPNALSTVRTDLGFRFTRTGGRGRRERLTEFCVLLEVGDDGACREGEHEQREHPVGERAVGGLADQYRQVLQDHD